MPTAVTDSTARPNHSDSVVGLVGPSSAPGAIEHPQGVAIRSNGPRIVTCETGVPQRGQSGSGGPSSAESVIDATPNR